MAIDGIAERGWDMTRMAVLVPALVGRGMPRVRSCGLSHVGRAPWARRVSQWRVRTAPVDTDRSLKSAVGIGDVAR